jgi:glucose/arabinose dehydrogenase
VIGPLPGDTTLVVAPSATTLAIGATRQLSAVVTTGAGAPVSVPVLWTSRNPAIATVSATGLVSGVAVGSTYVTASALGLVDSAAVTVNTTGTAAPGLELVSAGFTFPVYLTAPPTDSTRLFVVEKTGRIRIVRNDTLLATPFLDLASLVSGRSEQGLLSMAFHPQYAANRSFYVDYTDTQGNSRIVRYQRSAANPDLADPTSATLILTVAQPYANHNGGLIAFGPDGKLYVGLGDGGSGGDPENRAQNLDSLLGKLLRIDVDAGSPYAIPADNPFVGTANARGEIWAYGLRNPWRFSFDRTTGDLYIGDVGQGAREEVDVHPAGSAAGLNYGWNVMEGTICYNAATCSTAGLTLPVLDYPHTGGACSITGGYVYRGARLPILAGRYLYADYCAGWVRSLTFAGGQATDLMDWSADLAPGGSVTSFGEDAAGELYILTQGGAIYRIVPR